MQSCNALTVGVDSMAFGRWHGIRDWIGDGFTDNMDVNMKNDRIIEICEEACGASFWRFCSKTKCPNFEDMIYYSKQNKISGGFFTIERRRKNGDDD